MRIRILGCHGGVVSDYQTSSYWINEEILIDGGSIARSLSLQEQYRIADVLITHPHLDHIKDLAFLLENTFAAKRPAVVLHSTSAILDDVHKHFFNDVIWPDFSKINNELGPTLKFVPFKSALTLHGIKIRSCPVTHPGNAVGYILDDGEKQVVFTGDSGPTQKLWTIANSLPNLRAIFTEISFPSHMEKLAKASGHFTVQQMLDELEKIENPDIPIYIAHFKPLFFEELLEEFHSKAPPRLRLLHQDDEIVV